MHELHASLRICCVHASSFMRSLIQLCRVASRCAHAANSHLPYTPADYYSTTRAAARAVMADSYQYDLVTIGAGSGGVRASRFSAQYYGAKVAVVELPFGFVSSETVGGMHQLRTPHPAADLPAGAPCSACCTCPQALAAPA
jgi:hypothetical protein